MSVYRPKHKILPIPLEVVINASDVKRFFNVPAGIAKKLRFTDVSLYSSTPSDQSEFMTELLKSYHPDLADKTVTDGLACIGGNTWKLAECSKSVYAVELDMLHADILMSNMKALGISNVTVIAANYLDVLSDIKQDIVFLDPPWGGTDYKFGDYRIQLSSNTVRTLEDIIANLSDKCQTCILKLPAGYRLESTGGFPTVDTYDIKSYNGTVLYQLIVLSHVKQKTLIDHNTTNRCFQPAHYKSIEYHVKNVKR